MTTTFTLHRVPDSKIMLVLTRRNDDKSTTQCAHMFAKDEPMWLRLDHYMTNLEASLANHDELQAKRESGGAVPNANES